MLWTLYDGLVHNRRDAWAYIAVSGVRELGSDDFRDEIRDIVAELYPHMAIHEGS